MIQVPDLTPELLSQLGRELGGCDFTGENQKAFLTRTTSCDVQAAPGNGKTTLLVAKLALLSRAWLSRTQGICVISHTNTAREEVEKKLATHPTASAFLSYPHFIGTVTAFIDRFLALPYLRGLGWNVKRIDDEAFEAVACSRYPRKPTLRRSANGAGGKNKHRVKSWVSGMELAPDFVCAIGGPPRQLKIRNRGNGQPGAHTASGIELEQLKADLINDGYYRFGDMTVLANRGLDACPRLIERLRRRFPLVLLDEAQDTHGAQLALLSRLFSEGTAYQRLGDQNQTLYEDPEVPADGYWRPGENVIPLNKTRRFGSEIASFASRLTVRNAQQIEGKPGEPSRRILVLFDRESIGRVLPTYAQEVRRHWDHTLTPEHNIWAVASRHSLYQDNTGDWPKSLVDYWPAYRRGTGSRTRPNSLCGAMRRASLTYTAHKSTREVMDSVTSGLVDFIDLHSSLGPDGERPTSRNLWRLLAIADAARPVAVRRLIHDRVLKGNAAWEPVAWQIFCNDLRDTLRIPANLQDRTAANEFLQFDETGALDQQPEVAGNLRASAEFDGVTIKLGSIHSVKGRTVDAILVLETEVYRGRALAMRAMDLSVVLPHGLGIEDRDLTANDAQLTAATNVFVAVTRPRQVLSLALRKESATELLIQAALQQGWRIYDLTV